MSNITTKPKNEVAEAGYNLDDWGAPQALGQDIIIPKILVMQPSSVLVTDGKASMGEFRDSLSAKRLGSIAEPIDVIPFHFEKFWDIMEDQGNEQYKLVRSEPLIEDPIDKGYNDNLPWADTIEGKKIRRVRRINFYVLLPSEVSAGTATPYLLCFKSTSFREGKKIYTQMYMRNRRANLPPPAYTFKVAGNKTKNDKGTFIVPTVELGAATDKAGIQESLEWFKLIKKGGVKVDSSDEEVVDAVDVQGEDTGVGKF